MVIDERHEVGDLRVLRARGPAPARDATAVRHLVAFAAAAVTLLAVARSGADAVVVQAVLLLYAAVATLWVRCQYVDGLDGRQWALPGTWAVGLVGLGAGMGLVWWFTTLDGLLLGALFAFWLGASALVARTRNCGVRGGHGVLRRLVRLVAARRARSGAAVLVAGAAALVVGVRSLGGPPGGRVVVAAALAGAAVLVLLPFALGLLGEVAMTAVARAPRAPALLVSAALVAAGAVLLGGVAWAAWAVTGNVLVLVALGVLAVVVVGTVSATDADVVLLVAVLALLGVTPHQVGRPGPTAALTTGAPRDVVVALGDSYLSGEGAPEYYAGTDDPGVNQCRRAPTSWVVLASQDLGLGTAFLACSGAVAADVDRQAQPGGDGESQLARWRTARDRFALRPRLVVLSLGGNDAGFSTIGVMCLAPGSCADRPELWVPSLAQVRAQLRRTYAAVDATFPGVPVVVVGYPDPIDTDPDAAACRQVTITAPERRFVHDFLTGPSGLDALVSRTAAEYGFHYVADLQTALRAQDLQLCDPDNDDRPGLNFVGLRSVRGAAEQRFNPANWWHSSLHPNERGHAAMNRAFRGWYARETASGPLPARTTVLPATSGYPAVDRPGVPAAQELQAPVCDLYATDADGCRVQGTAWALQQTEDALWPAGVGGLLLGGAGAWCLAVGFFGWRRRVLSPA